MSWLLIGIVIVALIGLFAVTGGADTRDGNDWATHPRI